MNIIELAEMCSKSINGWHGDGEAQVLLVTPKGWKAPPKFPRSEIVQWKENGDRIRYVPALRLLAWLTFHFPDKIKIQGLPKSEQ